jgi:aspartate/methionine/tyrosine aminotransferase
VLTDEIYEHLVYGDNQFVSMPTVVPELADRCVIVNGVAKTYAMTGWRVGWMIGPADVMKASINFQSHSTSNVTNVAQMAALEAVSGDLSAVAMMRGAFARRAITMHSHPAAGSVLLLSERERPARPSDRTQRHGVQHHARAGRRHPRRGQGGIRAR